MKKTFLLLTLFVALQGCSSGPFAVKNLVLTDDPNTRAPKSTFTADTPKIYVYFDIQGARGGEKIRGVWTCVKSSAAPPNYKIDEATLDVQPPENSGNFSLSKPTKGWPKGDYKVDLYANTTLAQTVTFTVQ